MKIQQLTSILFFAMALVYLQVEQVQGLAFVTAVVNPIALRAVNPLRFFSKSPTPSTATITADAKSALMAHPSLSSAKPTKKKSSNEQFIVSDESMRLERSQMVDLVYERSLERMNSFSTQ